MRYIQNKTQKKQYFQINQTSKNINNNNLFFIKKSRIIPRLKS